MTNKPTILIFGATGGLGQYVVRECQKRELEYYVVTTDMLEDLSPRSSDMNEIDKFVEILIATRECPETLRAINCIGFGDVPGCEKDPIRSYKSNVQSIVEVSKFLSRQVHVVHMSTNDVFGQKAKYIGWSDPYKGWTNQNVPKPKGIYAIHKRLAEQVLKSIYPNDKRCIVRATMMSPWSKSKGGETFYYEAWKAFKDAGSNHLDPKTFESKPYSKPIRGYTNQGTCPVSINTLASALVDCALEKTTGIKHISSTNHHSRYDILEIIKKIVDNSDAILHKSKCQESRYAWLEPVEYDLEEECKKFVALCGEFCYNKHHE